MKNTKQTKCVTLHGDKLDVVCSWTLDGIVYHHMFLKSSGILLITALANIHYLQRRVELYELLYI